MALGDTHLPFEPLPGNGGLLLAAVVGASVPHLYEEVRDELDRLVREVEAGERIGQPRMRFRFQTDVVGLDRSKHRLVHDGRAMRFEYDDHGAPLPQALAAVYAAGRLEGEGRYSVFRVIRRATRWEGGSDTALLAFLRSTQVDGSRRDLHRDEYWAMELLGFAGGAEPARSEIIGRFRELVREAHPDHGGETLLAAERITDLTAAKRILLAS